MGVHDGVLISHNPGTSRFVDLGKWGLNVLSAKVHNYTALNVLKRNVYI